MKCFHHTDLDGRGAAYVVLGRYKDADIERDFIPVNYNSTLDLSIIGKDEEVFIVDFSFKPEDFIALLNITSNVVWIDHHKTAIEYYEKNYPEQPDGLRHYMYCGAMLTYMYFEMKEIREKAGDPMAPVVMEELYDDAPYYLKLINDHDLRQFRYGDLTRAFQLYLDTFFDTLGSWAELAFFDTQVYINKGKELLEYKRKTDNNTAVRSAFPVEFEGIKFLAINRGGNSAILEGIFDPDKYQASMLFQMGRDRRFKQL